MWAIAEAAAGPPLDSPLIGSIEPSPVASQCCETPSAFAADSKFSPRKNFDLLLNQP